MVDVRLASDAAVGCVRRVAPPPSGLYAVLADAIPPVGEPVGDGVDSAESYGMR
jgi:hypothetical protein